MKMGHYFFLFLLFPLSISEAYGQSFSCSPEHVTFVSNTTSSYKIEKTRVNWKRIDYHILEKKAVTMTYKDPKDPITKLNPQQTDELTVLENSPNIVVLLGASKKDSLAAIDSGQVARLDTTHLVMDVIFPQDGNGYSFYVSDYPKTLAPGNPEVLNVSKLYVLKCKDISKATP